MAPNTIRNCTSAIRNFAAVADQPIVGKELELVKAALKRAARENRGKAGGPAKGVTWRQVDKAAARSVADGGYRGYRDAAIIRVTSDAMMRVSEVSALNVEDLEIEPDGSGYITIRSSKSDQSGQGHTTYVGKPTVDALVVLVQITGIISGAFFRSERGANAGERINPTSVHYLIRKRFAAVGIMGISGHSLRRGGAADLVKAGAPISVIQEMGRWQDPRLVSRYAAGQLAAKNAMAQFRYGKDG